MAKLIYKTIQHNHLVGNNGTNNTIILIFGQRLWCRHGKVITFDECSPTII